MGSLVKFWYFGCHRYKPDAHNNYYFLCNCCFTPQVASPLCNSAVSSGFIAHVDLVIEPLNSLGTDLFARILPTYKVNDNIQIIALSTLDTIGYVSSLWHLLHVVQESLLIPNTPFLSSSLQMSFQQGYYVTLQHTCSFSRGGRVCKPGRLGSSCGYLPDFQYIIYVLYVALLILFDVYA